MTVYGSDLQLTVGKRQNKDNEATRAIDCAVLIKHKGRTTLPHIGSY